MAVELRLRSYGGGCHVAVASLVVVAAAVAVALALAVVLAVAAAVAVVVAVAEGVASADTTSPGQPPGAYALAVEVVMCQQSLWR
jgi:hypothetical protein